MTVGHAASVAVVGLQAVPVTVEAYVGSGLPGLHVIGCSGAAAQQAADRVRTALGAAGVTLPQQKALVSLAPADVPKAGARFDLAMAAAILDQLGLVEVGPRCALLGELALDGAVRAVEGVLPAAAHLAGTGRRLFVAEANAAEAALVHGVTVVAVRDLAELIAVLRDEAPPRAVRDQDPAQMPRHAPDLAEVRGQIAARRCLEVAAAGGHHLLLLGPPGCGKSMLARRLPGILPPLTRAQALELAAIRSVAGALRPGVALDRLPPFQAPHHSTSAASLLGGGTGVARPGALSLAHRGVLFLDELFEWPRGLLECLREPLEEGIVRLARSRATVTYPARAQVVAAANPCPCGGQACTCGDDEIWAYRSRLSGPLADRFDLAATLGPLTAGALLTDSPSEASRAVSRRVTAARAAAAHRWGRAATTNAEAPITLVRATAAHAALSAFAAAVERGLLTGRGFDRALRVARTCADLEGAESVLREHAQEALGHRLHLHAARGRATTAPAAAW